jgi:hypothetical protein
LVPSNVEAQERRKGQPLFRANFSVREMSESLKISHSSGNMEASRTISPVSDFRHGFCS